MWGNIWSENSYQLNFNIGFSSLKSDVLTHLAQWQYWWWFWFSLVWVFYYLIGLKVIRYRTLKMRPKISTSYRPHGKWGDFLACIIPLIWCINILTNSNLILRLVEWQNESSLFTVRVRARQWYWIYKFELKNFTDILSTPKNIGNNKWCVNTFGELQIADNYLHILQLRSQNKWVKNYWNKSLQETGKTNKSHIISAQDQLRLNLHKQYLNLELDNIYQNKLIKLNSSNIELSNNNNTFIVTNKYYNKLKYNNIKLNTNIKTDLIYNNIFKATSKIELYKTNSRNIITNLHYYKFKNILNMFNLTKSGHIFHNLNDEVYFYDLYYKTYITNSLNKNNFYKNDIFNFIKKIKNNEVKQIFKKLNLFNSVNINQKYTKTIKHEDFDEYSRWMKKNSSNLLPIRIIKYPIINILNTDNKADSNLFKIRFNSNINKLKHKVIQDNIYLTLKQKRYNRKKIITPQLKFYKDINDEKTNIVRYTGKPYLSNSKILESSIYDQTIQYKLIKKNKKRGELISITLARRLLRTKKTLVLPAHVNITLITNSYDIVHSWFIPSLGIKLDCVPGRSTHHTFFIDNVGFYYGQCAEICGRYHHHMPIRVCALPFEHFLLWWNNFGLPKMLNTTSKKKFEASYTMRKYSW